MEEVCLEQANIQPIYQPTQRTTQIMPFRPHLSSVALRKNSHLCGLLYCLS